MFILKAVCTPNEGQREEALAATRDLVEQSQAHEGLRGYLWTSDDASDELTAWEVYDEETATFHHIESADLSKMVASMAVVKVETYGDTPSAKLQQLLRSFGEYQHFPNT